MMGMQTSHDETYPNRIRAFRLRLPRAAGITQQKLADALRITQPAFHALEHGRRELTAVKAMILAPLLHCQPWELSPELEKLAKTYESGKAHTAKRPRKKHNHSGEKRNSQSRDTHAG
jgi:transcriptional regulator with XRE-family HTH domain